MQGPVGCPTGWLNCLTVCIRASFFFAFPASQRKECKSVRATESGGGDIGANGSAFGLPRPEDGRMYELLRYYSADFDVMAALPFLFFLSQFPPFLDFPHSLSFLFFRYPVLVLGIRNKSLVPRSKISQWHAKQVFNREGSGQRLSGTKWSGVHVLAWSVEVIDISTL